MVAISLLVTSSITSGLEKLIADHLADEPFCVVAILNDRAEAIQAFAREHGWTATISASGIRMTFRKINS